jgi:hypothetical protein
MAVNTLVIGRDERKEIRTLMEHAYENKLTLPVVESLRDTFEAGEEVDDTLFHFLTIKLPCYTITYTVEEHFPGIYFRHLSAGILKGRKGIPAQERALREIAKEFGFVGGMGNIQVITESSDDDCIVVSLMQPMSGSWEAAHHAIMAIN